MLSNRVTESHVMSESGAGDSGCNDSQGCNDAHCKDSNTANDEQTEELLPEPPAPEARRLPKEEDMDVVVATQYGRMERVRHLFATQNVDVNRPDKEGCYLLHWAAINNRVDLIK